MGLIDGLHASAAVLLGSWAVAHCSALREPQQRSVWVAVAALSATQLIRVTPVHQGIEAAWGPGWDAVLYVGLFMVVGLAGRDFLHLMHGDDRRARARSAGVGVAALALSIVPWVVDAPTAAHPSQDGAPTYYDAGWQAAWHAAVVVTYLGWVEVTLVRHYAAGARRAHWAGAHHVSTGIWLVTAGVGIGLLSLLGHAYTEAMWLLGRGALVDAPADGVDSAVILTAVVLPGLGVAWPMLMSRVESWRETRSERVLRRQVDALRPHWAWLVGELPEISPFAAALRRTPGDFEQLDFHRMRMVAEIHDATRRLSLYLSEEDRALFTKKVQACGVRGPAAQAAVNHVCLQVGSWRRTASPQRTGRCAGPALPAPASAASIVADLRRVRRPRARKAIAAVLEEEAP